MPDGLDSLAAMRTTKTATSRRTLPPPRHQPRSTPVQMPEPAAQHVEPPPASQRVEPPSPPQAAVPPAGTDLTKASIYLDETTDAYLETVRTAARTVKPRVDATRSAVVRLALNRLAEQFTPAEVVAELQRSAAAHSGPGRKRA